MQFYQHSECIYYATYCPIMVCDIHNKESDFNNNQALVKKTYGAIKTKGYKPNEFELAKKHFVKKYKNKNGIK